MTMQIEQVRGMIDSLWGQIPQEYMIVFTFCGAVFALLNCFMGYRLRKVWGVFWDFSQEEPAGA